MSYYMYSVYNIVCMYIYVDKSMHGGKFGSISMKVLVNSSFISYIFNYCPIALIFRDNKIASKS